MHEPISVQEMETFAHAMRRQTHATTVLLLGRECDVQQTLSISSLGQRVDEGFNDR